MAERPSPPPPPTPVEGAQGEYRLGERLGIVASNAGLALGVLYALGALSLLAELRGAGVATTAAFPLIPIEDHLSRGLDILFSRTGLLLAFLLIASTFVFEELAERRQAKAGEGRAAAPGGIRRWVSENPRLSVALLVAAYAALLVWRPILVGQQLVAMTVAFLALSAVSHFARGAKLATSTRVLVTALGVATGFVARGYAFPAPLPLAEVTVLNAPSVKGEFIGIVDNAWYLAPRRGVIEAVGDRYVVTGRIMPRERAHDWQRRSLPELLTR
jgi:hypothetical protein